MLSTFFKISHLLVRHVTGRFSMYASHYHKIFLKNHKLELYLRIHLFFKNMLIHFPKIIPILKYLLSEHQNWKKVYTKLLIYEDPKQCVQEHLQAYPNSKDSWGCSSGDITACTNSYQL